MRGTELISLYLAAEVSVRSDGRPQPVVPVPREAIQNHETFHVITAWNPGEKRLTLEENRAADERLRKVLTAKCEPVRAIGRDRQSDHLEEGWAVRGLSNRQARSIGREFGQHAVFLFTPYSQKVLGCFENWQIGRPLVYPTVSDLELAHQKFGKKAQNNWMKLREKTSNRIDLTNDAHVRATVKWLNEYGCRIHTEEPEGQFPVISELSSWWQSHLEQIEPIRDKNLAELSDSQLEAVADAFQDLSARPANSGRSFAPTAASKVLMALSPSGIPAWDKEIALSLYASRGRTAFRVHLSECRAWAITLRDEIERSGLLKSEHVGQAKLIDEWLYMMISRMQKVAT